MVETDIRNTKDERSGWLRKPKVFKWAFLILTAYGILLLYSSGNGYVVRNTMLGMSELFGMIILGAVIGVLCLYLISLTPLEKFIDKEIAGYYGLWMLYGSVMLTIFTILSLNIDWAKEGAEEVRTPILAKSGDALFRINRVEVDVAGDETTITLERTLWEQYEVGDTISLYLIHGYFGYDALRLKSNS